MHTVQWRTSGWADRLRDWIEAAREPGVVRVEFRDAELGERPRWRRLEPWTKTRAVTVADIRSSLGSPALEVALCSDLVYIEQGCELAVGCGEPSAGVLWALGRAGRAAVARGLLDPTPIAAREAMGLGLAHGVVSPGESAGPGGGASMTALTTARDLMRARCGSRSSAALELAAFRLLFAAGDPIEGAGAFLERRDPVFPAADPTRSRWEDST